MSKAQWMWLVLGCGALLNGVLSASRGNWVLLAAMLLILVASIGGYLTSRRSESVGDSTS